MNIVHGYKISVYGCKLVNSELLRNRFDEYKITKIALDGSIIYPDKKVLMCDSAQPMSYVNNVFTDETLCIDKDFFDRNTQSVLDTILFICTNTKESKLILDDTILINDEIINAILNNPNLEEVTLGNKDDHFILTEELYNRFKNSSIKCVKTDSVVDSLKEVFDPLIGYNTRRNLIGYDNYESLISSTSKNFRDPLTEGELFYLKLINPNCTITISHTDYDNAFKIINRLRDNGHTANIKISITDKNLLNNYIFSNIDKIKYTKDIEIYLVGKTFSLTDYMKYEKKLLDLIMPAINLSPFEKYLFAYNVTKKFKKYNENEENKTSARDLYQIIDNEFMVCVGYSKLLGDLLDKLGIENYVDSVSVDIGLDDIPNENKPLPDFVYDEKTGTMKELETIPAGHSRRKIHLVDPKYGIDGYYFADPTWDNDMEHDAYNHALMTEEEYIALDRYNYYNVSSGIVELFFVHSLEEFYLKINNYLDRKSNKTEVDVVVSLLDEIKVLDNEFYKELCSKYDRIDSASKKFTKEEIQNILLDIGERILQKSDNLVSGRLFKEGITTLYREVYGLSGEELENKVNEVMEYNKKRHSKCFPTRYKVDRNDNSMVLFNRFNKFDLDNEPRLGI